MQNNSLKLRCYNLSLETIKITTKIKKSLVSEVLMKQLLRSITSVGANVVEAQAASSRLDFKKYHEIALKSANESKYWLCLIRDSKIGESGEVAHLLTEVTEISNMLAAGILKLKGKK